MNKIHSHADLIKPKWNEIIWRYFSLEKFLDLIMNERLYFTRTSNLTDGYEGIPLTNKPISAVTNDSVEIDRANKWHQQIEIIKNTSFVNCWSLGIHESFALWKIYLGGSGTGVAIRTNFKGLSDSLNLSSSQNLEIFASKVKYANYSSIDHPSDHEVIITKRPFYEFENELRLFFFKNHPNAKSGKSSSSKPGHYLDVNIDTLIDNVYLSPFAGSWFLDLVIDLFEQLHPSLVSKITISGIRER